MNIYTEEGSREIRWRSRELDERMNAKPEVSCGQTSLQTRDIEGDSLHVNSHIPCYAKGRTDAYRDKTTYFELSQGFQTASTSAKFDPSGWITSLNLNRLSTAANRLFQSSSSRSWEFESAIIVTSKLLVTNVSFDRLVVDQWQTNRRRRSSFDNTSPLPIRGKTASMISMLAPGFSAGMRALRILMQYLSDQLSGRR